MKGLTISAHGGLDQLELRDDLPMPQVQRPTDVRVRMRAAALNHLDLFVVGGLPGVTITPPWVLVRTLRYVAELPVRSMRPTSPVVPSHPKKFPFAA